MLSKALNDPKKWGWLLEPLKDDKHKHEMDVQEMIHILGLSPHKELSASSLFGKGIPNYPAYYGSTPKKAPVRAIRNNNNGNGNANNNNVNNNNVSNSSGGGSKGMSGLASGHRGAAHSGNGGTVTTNTNM